MTPAPLPRRDFLKLAGGTIVALGVGHESHAAAPSKPAGIRLIVRGDDMGFSHSGNEALIRCHREGIETSIEVIAPSPWFPEAAGSDGRTLTRTSKICNRGFIRFRRCCRIATSAY